MAHALRNNDWDEGSQDWQDTPPERNMDDWNALRDELECLLDQVKSQTTEAQQTSRNTFNSSPFAEISPNQYQSSVQLPPDRHSQALASVQRAVDRFSEQEEAMNMPAQSQHQLQNAIRQIRSSQRGHTPRPRQGSQSRFESMPNHNAYNSSPNRHREPFTRQSVPANNQLNDIDNVLRDIDARMESFEHAIGNQQNSDTAVSDMAIQVEQLSGVVEHLANNIGERGQIKRLENQIAKMADAIHNGAGLDIKSLNKRLDMLSGAFEQLRDLQVQQVELNIKANGDGGYMDTIENGVRNIYERLDDIGMDKLDLEPVETCVRTVYDRIDALEQTMAMPTPAIERLSREMADFTKSMRNEDGASLSADLIAQVGGLVSRIEQIETEGSSVGDLKIDMGDLQTSVVAAMEPRFLALEEKIGTFGGKSNGKQNVDILEQHIRALAAKLDKTSSELTGLRNVFSQKSDGSSLPDINALAEMVAQRTSEAMAKMQTQTGQGIEQKALDQLEARLSGLFTKQAGQTGIKEKGSQEISQVQSSIEQVNQRLARLETTLGRQAKQINPVIQENPEKQQASETPTNSSSRRRVAPQRSRHPGLSERHKDEKPSQAENWEPSQHLIPELRDNMPRPPAQDGPLKAPLFKEKETGQPRIPVPASLRVDPNDLGVVENEVHELDEPLPATHAPDATGQNGRIKLPTFNEENVTPPPAPASSFDQSTGKSAAQSPAAKQSPTGAQNQTTPETKPDSQGSANGGGVAKTSPDPQLSPDSEKVSRSTFIEAARRAAQSKNVVTQEAGSQSIIGRAMARFKKKKTSGEENKQQQAPAEKMFAGDGNIAATNKNGPTDQSTKSDDLPLDDLTTVPESFLTRHRQPILLVATVVAVGFLTLNLVNQRFSGADAQPAGAVSEMGSAMVEQGKTGIAGEANMASQEASAADTILLPEGTVPNSEALGPRNPSDQNTGDVVGSIDRFSGVPNSPVRIIDPVSAAEMPQSLAQGASVRTASLNMDVPSNSLLGLELPPEAIGPLLLRQTAAEGDPQAQFEIGAIFAEGRALTQDLGAAAKWYERAAAQGFAPASYRLANMLENGVGVEKNLASARLWYQLAADAGNRMSMHNLASLLASGQLGDQQFESAAHWFEQAASLGLKDSQFNLGMLYARGLGVPQSLENSFKWFSIAASAGDEDAAKARDDIARSLEPQIVAGLRNDVMAWEPSAMNIKANFAPIGTWSPSFDPGPDIDAREVIIKVQTALNGIGFDTGIPDGLIGPKTIEAISAFEVKTGMIPSGKVNPRLLAVLGSQPI